MFDDFYLKKGTESFLKGTSLLIEAAVPQSNRRLVNSNLESLPLSLHVTLKDQQSESLLVSPKGWFWEGDGTGGEIVSLDCETNLDGSVVLMVFLEEYLRYWVGTIIPDGGSFYDSSKPVVLFDFGALENSHGVWILFGVAGLKSKTCLQWCT